MKKSSPKLSTSFIFDGGLLGSKVYQGTMRSLIRRVSQCGKDAKTELIRLCLSEWSSLLEDEVDAARSNKIDAPVTKSSKEIGRRMNVLVAGLPQSGKSTLSNWMRQ